MVVYSCSEGKAFYGFLPYFTRAADRNFVLGNAQVTDLPIIYCNDGFCELTGYSRAELVQKHCSCDFLCGENSDAFAAREVKSALKGQEEKHVEILYYKKDGKISERKKKSPKLKWAKYFTL